MNNFFKTISDKLRFKSDAEGVTNLFYVILIIFVFVTVGSFFYLKNQLNKIKNNWEKYKCNPAVIPFAGIINPDPNMTAAEFTSYNLKVCISQVLVNIVKVFTAPFKIVFGGLNTFFGGVLGAIQDIRVAIWKLKDGILKMIESILSYFSGAVIVTNVIFQKVLDTIKRVIGTFSAFIYAFISFVFWVFSSLKQGLKAVLYILLILTIILLLILPFTFFPMFFPFMVIAYKIFKVIYILLSVPMGIMAILMAIYIGLVEPMLPDPGTVQSVCFDKNTIIETKRGNKAIKNIKVGDKLKKGGIVTGVFKVSSVFSKEMYRLNNVLVTGSHKVMVDDEMISVKDHPCAELIEDYREPTLYCLNTSSKRIYINGVEFMDWDEIINSDLDSLRMCGYFNSSQSYEDIHKQLDGGFDKSVKLEMYDGGSVNINKIKVNDVLKFGERVVGVIKIDASALTDVKKYDINGSEFISGPNVMLEDENLGKVSTLFLEGTSLMKRPRYLYSIITDTGKFYYNGLYFYDYNGGIEEILDHMAYARQLS